MKAQLGHYELIAELGRGGMGVVYKGYETSLNRYVAIKVFAESLAHDASVKERFLREARSMAALNDPHIIQIFFIGEDAGQTYFVMEFVDGESLGSLLKREGQLTPEQAAKVIHLTALGLASAHDKGVIHRDIKPGNLMVTSKGNIKIADFGIALKVQDFSKKLTSTGEFVGTPGYLSPEVCLNKPVDQRSDIFSLGVVLFECLAGRMPFKDDSPLGLMLEVVSAQIPDVRALNADVDTELSRILTKMIAKDPADRYQSCRELVTDLAKHPLVAKGGEIPLRTLPSPAAATMVGAKTPLSGQRPTKTPTPRPVAALVPAGPRASTYLEERFTRVAKRAHKRRVAAIAAAAIGLVAATGWAYRERLPLGGSTVRADPDAVATMTPDTLLNTSGTTTNFKAGVMSDPGGRTGSDPLSSTGTSMASAGAGGEDPIPDDALWLADVPDEFLQANAYDDFVKALPLPTAAEQQTDPRVVYSTAYVYPPALLPLGPAPVTYYAPVAWHFGYSFGFAVGWYNVVYLRQIYIGPVRQVAFVGSRPAPVAVPVVPFRPNYSPPPTAQPQPVSNTTAVASRTSLSTGIYTSPVQGVALASSRPVAIAPSNLNAPTSIVRSPAALSAVRQVSSPSIPVPAIANASRPPIGMPASAMASTSRPPVTSTAPARPVGPAQQKPQETGMYVPNANGGGPRSQPIRPEQRRNQALMAERAQRREVMLANQNARRAAVAQAKVTQARAHAEQARAAREHKERRHPT